MLRQPLYVAAGVASLLVGVARWGILGSSSSELPQTLKATRIEAEPICPWREPEPDLRTFFPEADAYDTETRILSGFRTELAWRLGRTPTAGENTLRLYRVYRRPAPLGTILTSRVKGEYGAIEIVLAVDIGNVIRGLRLQRLREPEPIATALQQPGWLGAFQGTALNDLGRLERDLPPVPAPARVSAEAVVDGIRGLLIRLDVAQQAGVPVARRHH